MPGSVPGATGDPDMNLRGTCPGEVRRAERLQNAQGSSNLLTHLRGRGSQKAPSLRLENAVTAAASDLQSKKQTMGGTVPVLSLSCPGPLSPH